MKHASVDNLLTFAIDRLLNQRDLRYDFLPSRGIKTDGRSGCYGLTAIC